MNHPNTNEYIKILQDRNSESCHITFLATSDQTNLNYLEKIQIDNISYHAHFLIEEKSKNQSYSWLKIFLMHF